MHQKGTLKKKWLWNIIFGLVIINCLTLAFLAKQSLSLREASSVMGQEDIIATVGDTPITRGDRLRELEKMYGDEVARILVNQEVIKQMAEKYKVTISDEAVEREWKMIKTMYNRSPLLQTASEESVKQQIRSSLLLEELLVKDVTISEEELENYYQENEELYTIDDSFHLSHIVVKTEEEANMVKKELEDGSSFPSLAMELSTDELTANQGGDLGFLTHKSETYPAVYLEEASKLEDKKWSNPIPVEDYFVVLYLHEKINSVTYSFEDVKNQIRRQLALEHMEGTMDPSIFWNEIGVEWHNASAQ
ncbi:peptidyl-prolyl cis-trans isomerase [Sutcliffiella deserti]|uniref:peptidyl-prolyl cis-trans isomerase n=1 Tax=Sutcliffiella deserti TaxID=2875501 RepID=UPI001CBD16B9|nr:peptidyl-prolyl cis-trans isomerase [Sutcliffiella deserti]